MSIDYAALLPTFKENVMLAMAEVQGLLKKPANTEYADTIHRNFHSIGSSAALMQFPEISALSREAEALCQKALDAGTFFTSTTTESLVVYAQKLETLVKAL